MYSKKKMEEALKVYHSTKSVGKTVQKPGYPTRRQLYSWINNKGNVPVDRKQLPKVNIPAGKIYLSPIVDCFDGLLVTWNISTKPNAALVNTMLDNAIATLHRNEHPILHSDRGCHYRWDEWCYS